MHTTLLRVKYMPNHKKLTCYNVMIQRIITSISTHLRSSRHRLQVYIFTRDRLPSITRNKRFENDLWTIQPTVVNNFFAFPRDGINLSNAVGARERATCVFRQSANLFVVGVRKCWASTNSSRTFSALDDRPLLLISMYYAVIYSFEKRKSLLLFPLSYSAQASYLIVKGSAI